MNKGIEIIKGFESCELKAYPDPGSKDGHPWTIGWGHTKGVKPGDTCTQAQADEWLAADLVAVEAAIAQLVYVPLTENQYGALSSFIYNLGATQFMTSTLRRKINAQDYAGAGPQFDRWVMNDGKKMNGLVRRRKAERDLWERVDSGQWGC